MHVSHGPVKRIGGGRTDRHRGRGTGCRIGTGDTSIAVGTDLVNLSLKTLDQVSLLASTMLTTLAQHLLQLGHGNIVKVDTLHRIIQLLLLLLCSGL
jgi:hypothetical protein